MTSPHSSLRQRAIAAWLILLLLVAQGLRVCIPAEAGDHHDSAIHLESLLTAAVDHHESTSAADTDLTLSSLLQVFAGALVCGALLAFAVLSFVPLPVVPLPRPDERAFRPPRGSGLTPPLRAPPR